ncbi:MAG: alpha-galactosidase [Planctomycetota bacterium]|nr:alpha-galactosidase [Planctomycetota bacterium]
MRVLLGLAICAGLATGIPGQAPDWLLDDGPYRTSSEAAEDGSSLVLQNGLIRARWRLEPNAALVGLETGANRQQLLRAVRPFGRITVDGQDYPIGGLAGQPNHAFLLPEWLDRMQATGQAFRCTGFVEQPLVARLPWKRTRPTAPGVQWPPPGRQVAFSFAAPEGSGLQLALTVYVAMYDGLPLLCQWFEVENRGQHSVEVDRFTSVQLAVVEAESRVEPERVGVRLPNIHVETDFAFRAMTGVDGSAHCVRWLPDPQFATQVNYRRQTRCLLEVGPELGPAQTLRPGAKFTTFRTWLLCCDREDRERRGLAVRRMYRTIAPWTTENPLMMHVRSADPAAVRSAIDQCSDVGFEMAILTFGSGFQIEDDSAESLDRYRRLADYAHSKQVQLGGYSLLSSRRIQPDGDNCINLETGKPGGQVFGYAPALASDWGQTYFRKLYRFFEYTGFDLLEHDGSYPGDPDAAARPPLQKGHADSRWVQYGIVADFYNWCRGRGIYLNVPDWYFLQGSNKTGMGYRETNWSLPRRQQVIHTRQNLFDGTREKTPSMGWMFVPLTQYHGGGAAATIEPLAEHLAHYELMLASNLGWGAQACYRGPRLYDTEAVRGAVRRWVDWYLRHRAILESDVIHGSSRRACGRWLDWVLHANPTLEQPGMLVVYNPTDAEVTASLPLDLYYTGLAGDIEVTRDGGGPQQLRLDARGRTTLPVVMAPQAVAGFVFRRAD